MKEKPKCNMEFTKDAHGKEILLKDGKFQVMMEWEKPYMQACIDALAPSGDVLEVGFGCGYSAERIQTFNPKSHTIIEFHPEVAKKARAFAKTHPNVIIIEDTWQNALAHLGVFDAIFFDDYPLESEEEMKQLKRTQEESIELLKSGNALIQEVETLIPDLHTTAYSDRDIEEFIGALSAHPEFSEKHLIRFLADLEKNNQITREQREKTLHNLVKKQILKEMPSVTEVIPPKTAQCARSSDRFFGFLHEALEKHMRIGSRFSCFLSSSQSKYEDKKFYEEIILNPHLEYREERIQVDVPDNCDYYTDPDALVITITKV
ncbi:MAG: class I SAM-dependent methyltransferase [Rhabdochlamydiaceae bacterium]|nr:class I SAM-dependent methyltransferase [Rhabdochlamydiaceae bacterium]